MVAIDKLLQEGQLAESFSMIQAEETYSKMVEHVDTLKANPKLAVKVQLYLSKIVSMIRKYHNHKLQTTPWHCEEEPLNHHETPGRQIKQSNQLSLPHQDDCNTRMDIK